MLLTEAIIIFIILTIAVAILFSYKNTVKYKINYI